MSYTATLTSSSFSLQDPVEQSALSIEALLDDPYVMDSYPVELTHYSEGKFMLEMLDTNEVGDSFHERVEDLLKQIQPFLVGAVQVILRNCDSASDDRDMVIYAGASPQDIQDLKREMAIQEAIEILAGAGLSQDDPVLQPLILARMDAAEESNRQNSPDRPTRCGA